MKPPIPPPMFVKPLYLAMTNLWEASAIRFQVELRRFERHGAQVAVHNH